ncbi:MAG TPA: metallophosphoesterase [Pirellulales bacterium]|jgi:serine/threonine protein phosphatase 1|nr:metallophosphoesterase [Pirellulales bacterium]
MLLAVGDIHGCFAALETLAAAVPFSDDDLLVTVGDYIDRGPDSRSVVDWLIDRWRGERLIPLRGNHELVLERARGSKELETSWLTFGGDATLASYAARGTTGRMDDIPAEHWDFFEHACRDYYEIDTHFFVHANADPQLPLDKQSEQMLFWEKFNNPPPHVSGKIMVCGHTAQKSGMPNNIGHAVCIDTWVYGDGWLTCLEPATGRFWQANQRRQWRPGRLGEGAGEAQRRPG